MNTLLLLVILLLLIKQSSSFHNLKTYNVLKTHNKQKISSKNAIDTVLIGHTLISVDDKLSLWTVAAVAAATGLRLERTSIGKMLSGPVCAMLITSLLTNLGVVPSGSGHMQSLQVFVVKLATPLLLLGADLKKIFRVTKSLMKCFFLGTMGTLLGSSLGFYLFSTSLSGFGEAGDSWKIAGALTAKNIGGGINFMAVVDSLTPSPLATGTGLAVDNLLGLLYFPLVSWIGSKFDNNTSVEAQNVSFSEEKIVNNDTNLESMTNALALGMTIAATSEIIARIYSIPSVPISTLISVILATSFPKLLNSIIPSGEKLGNLGLMLFFGSIGASSGTLATTFSSTGAAALCGYEIVLYMTHLLVIIGFGNLFKFDLKEVLVASNANIGNSATAAAFASGKGWKHLVLPAFLIGTFGNIIGTFLGLLLGQLLKNMANNVL